MKKLILSIGLFMLLFTSVSFADDFEIIPKSKDPAGVVNSVDAVSKEGGRVWDNYNKEADGMKDISRVGDQISSGIMTRDTLIYYVVYLIRFISQIGLLIGGVMIIYAGYMYATTIFGGDASKGKSAIKNAIIGVLIIAFSYAIMKLLTAAFLT